MKTKILHIIIAAALLSIPSINFGQAPDLGTASDFALFTANGAFGNTGATSVTGDIGTNVGAFTGFPSPGSVDGQIHVADPVSAQAAIDVNSVYSYLAETTCGAVTGTTLGNNQVLTPNVYCMGAASSLNGVLTLDAQGDPNAIFIFQIDGALLVSASSNVILINSASSFNVYWQINGEFELGDGSVFRGNIVANGAISLLEGSSLLGRGLSRAGAISLHNNMVAFEMPTMPVELLGFIAYPAGAAVQLNWSTASETNNDYFTVERSKDGIEFEKAAVIIGAGNNNTLINYSSNDEEPFSGISYYRLKQTDFNGKYTYSNLVQVDFIRQQSNFATIYPNPFSTTTTIQLNNDASQINETQLRIYNVFGEEVMNTSVIQQSTIIETSDLPSGIYLYKVIKKNQTIQSGKLISQQ